VSRDEVQAQGASFHGNRAAACELTRHAKLSNKLNSEHRLGMATYTGDSAGFIFLQMAVALQKRVVTIHTKFKHFFALQKKCIDG